MKSNIITIRNKGFAWYHHDDTHVKGYIFNDGDTLKRDNSFAKCFSKIKNAAHFETLLNEVNGSFAIIANTDRYLFAAVDFVRSIPLFFSTENGEFLIGDDASAMQEELGGCQCDPVAKEEFLRFGYTQGPYTLDPRIMQIEAGELLVYDKSTGQRESQPYFSHSHGNYTNKNEKLLIEELDQITTNWTRRLIQSAQGRTIVVPLSGGYDSRYIVCALKRENYENVMCYSYGDSDSYEHKIACKVAKQLDYPIHVINYNRRAWKEMLKTSCLDDYCDYAFQQNSVPCIQELLARFMLLKMKVIPSESIIVPGYCGDLQGGSFVPTEILDKKSRYILAEGIAPYIFRDRFTLQKTAANPDVELTVLGRILAYTDQSKTDNEQDFCSALEDWITRNQVAKYVINTLRTHEFFENEWRLPLWDKELIKWWYQVPLGHRRNSKLFHKFLFERMFTPAQVAFRKPRKGGQLNRMAHRWLPPGLTPWVRSVYKKTLRRTVSHLTSPNDGSDESDYFYDFLLRQLESNSQKREFTNRSGLVAAWYLKKSRN